MLTYTSSVSLGTFTAVVCEYGNSFVFLTETNYWINKFILFRNIVTSQLHLEV